jgi:hypothetical protein
MWPCVLLLCRHVPKHAVKECQPTEEVTQQRQQQRVDLRALQQQWRQAVSKACYHGCSPDWH